MKKYILSLSILLLSTMVFSGCSHQQGEQTAAVNIDKEEIIKEFSMTAKQWEFIPSEITVNQGDTVRLKITSTDVKHGFAIPEFNVDADLIPKKETIVEFKADKSGSFTFSCSVYCGSGHKGMKGVLVVN